MSPAAKSLILDLLSTLRPGAVMPVGVLVEAGGLFGLSDNNIRVSAARLLAAGQIARDERGCYRLGERAVPISRRVRSWRELDRRTRRWGGGWIGVEVVRSGRKDGRARGRALSLMGLAPLRESLWLRPDNLVGSVDAARAELGSLGLPDADLVFAVSNLDPSAERRARKLWNVEELRRSYRDLLADLAAGAERIAGLAVEDAMVESFLLGGRALRQLLRDPLLPEEICPATERSRLLEAMRRYDRLGRLAWAELLKRWGVPYLTAPLDGRIESRRARLAS